MKEEKKKQVLSEEILDEVTGGGGRHCKMPVTPVDNNNVNSTTRESMVNFGEEE